MNIWPNNLNILKEGLFLEEQTHKFYILVVAKKCVVLEGDWIGAVGKADVPYLTTKKLFNPKRTLRIAFNKGLLDNLTYVENLAFIKQHEHARKSKKSVQ